jgi:6-phosphogluconate dehydrogenase
MRFGMIGLGRMGSGIARRAVQSGHECVGYDRDSGLVGTAAGDGVERAASIDDLLRVLPTPRVVWVMVPVVVTGAVVDDLIGLLEPGDVLIDGGNSNYRDSMARASAAARAGVGYLDVGTSGGVFGAERGYCLMAGGDAAAFARAEPLFRSLAPGVDGAARTPGRRSDPAPAEQGYLHCGPSGAGHFAKMIHNGIEYGMMAAMAEGLNILEAAKGGSDRFAFDIGELTELWRRGSVISSWLLDLTAAALADDPSLEGFAGHVSDSGEGRWTVQAAIELGAPAHVLSAALFDRFASRGNASFANKVLSAMRSQFGGHREEGRSK